MPSVAPAAGPRPLEGVEDILEQVLRQGGPPVLDRVLDALAARLGARSATLLDLRGGGPQEDPLEGLPNEALAGIDRAALEGVRGRGTPGVEPPAAGHGWRIVLPARRGGRAVAALIAETTQAPGVLDVPPAHLESLGTLLLTALRLDACCTGSGSEAPPAGTARGVTRRAAEGGAVERKLEELFPGTVARSPALRSVLHAVAELAGSEIPVLIEGESGTGKELIAQAVHRLSPRRDGPFVGENCGAVPASLFESEFFGHERGAFTGADNARPGLLERATGGTLFLDEVGEMDPEQQKKLLRALQERRVRRVGSRETRDVDFRVVSATNRELERRVAEGRFREDLYYRLQAATVRLPPLRDRPEDIPALAAHFQRGFAAETGRSPLPFTPAALDALRAYAWPGNVRELRNEVWRLTVTARREVRPADLSPRIARGRRPAGRPSWRPGEKSLPELEREVLGGAIREALRITAGNVAEAARVLGIPRSSLYRRMRRYEVDGPG